MAKTSATFRSGLFPLRGVGGGLPLHGGRQLALAGSAAVVPRYSGVIWVGFLSALDTTLSRFSVIL